MMTFNASTWVRVCGPNSDKAFRLMTGVWRRQEIKTSGDQLNKKSVRKRPFDIKCQILSEELEMTSVEEIRIAERMLTCNNPEALEQKFFSHQYFVGLLTTSLHEFFLTWSCFFCLISGQTEAEKELFLTEIDPFPSSKVLGQRIPCLHFFTL